MLNPVQNNNTMKKIFSLIIIGSLIVACVPPNKFKALQKESVTCQEERDRLRGLLLPISPLPVQAAIPFNGRRR
jgi:hypothetical protein